MRASATRVYLPASAAVLAVLHRDGALPAGVGFAVTPGLRAWWVEGQGPLDPRDADEQLEAAAFGQAADGSLRSLADELDESSSPAPRGVRRVVVAADVPADRVVPVDARGAAAGTQPGAVRLAAPVPLASVASVHADEPAATADVAAAVRLLSQRLAPDASDDEVTAALDRLDDHDLAWWARQEVGDLLAALEA